MKLQREELHQRATELKVRREALSRAALMIRAEMDRHEVEGGLTSSAPWPSAPVRTLPMLSPRQRRVLEGILAGLANKTIAFDLGVSTKTVETHRARLMEKLHARSFADLVRICIATDASPDNGHGPVAHATNRRALGHTRAS